MINLIYKHRIKIIAHQVKALYRFIISYDLRIIIANYTYIGDGIVTRHFLPFASKDIMVNFLESFKDVPKKYTTLRKIEWRFSILIWAINQTKSIKGDIVECGVWYGILSKALLNQFSNTSLQRNFILFDSWGEEGFSMKGPYKRWNYLKDIFEVVRNRFQGTSAVLVRGTLPDSLFSYNFSQISILMIDLNSGWLEKEILEILWDKISLNGIIYFDDYGQDFPLIREAIDEFVEKYRQSLLVFPTGQAVIIKV